ncbi:aldo/keto reductase [Acidobacteriota bacterium]
MKTTGKKQMTRKEFLKKTSTAVIGLGLMGKSSGMLIANKYSKVPETSNLRTLGRTGIKVTPVGFGASRTMEPALVRYALDKGMTFLDTGRSYSRGKNEYMLGEVIKGFRKDIVIQSKISLNMRSVGQDLSTQEAHRRITEMMNDSMEESLKALQTDYIDIMLFHGASTTEIINHEAVIKYFEAAKKSGKIRACGFSSHTNHVELLRDANKSLFYEVVMVPYNHKGSFIHMNSGRFDEWDQPALEVEIKRARENDIAVMAMKSCSAGAYSPDKDTPASFEHALRWVLKNPAISSAPAAMGNFEQVDEDVKAME